MEDLINKVDQDREALRTELNDLINKATAFNLASRGTDVKKHISELEEKFKHIDKKKSGFTKELSQLTKIFKGKY